jgi:hypothetical protein
MRCSALAAAVGRPVLLLSLIVVGLPLSGCAPERKPTVPTANDLFVPTEMRIHPIFTRVTNLTTPGKPEGKPDGIEAQLEFDDQFGDPVKASGQVLFELFEYRKQPPFTGKRVGGPWVASLATPADQRDKWEKALRTYRFPLSFPGVVPTQDYVLTATFELTGGGRFPVSKLVLTGRSADKGMGEGKGPLGF